MGALLAILAFVSAALLGANTPYISGINDPNSQPGQEFLTKELSCKPQINKNRIIKVQIKPGLEPIYTSANPHHNKDVTLDGKPDYDFDVTDDEWILVKEDALIPAWKVDLEARFINGRVDDRDGVAPYAEMEEIGTAVGLSGSNPDNGNSVYIGTGWCDPKTGTGTEHQSNPTVTGNNKWCLDPLVQDVVFVVTHQGLTFEEYYANPTADVPCDAITKHAWQGCHDWGRGTMDIPPRNKENLDNYWWSFDVYYKASKLPAEPTEDDLPCWMTELQCQSGIDAWVHERFDISANPNCEIDPSLIVGTVESDLAMAQSALDTVLGISSDVYADEPEDTKRPKLIISKNFFTGVADTVDGITIETNYLSSQKLINGPLAGDKLIGTAYNNHFNVYLRKGNISGTSADHALILDPAPAGHTGPYWMYVPILADSKPDANSLQLGSFVPGIPSFFYEWWTPSCKPALYLYPEKETELSVFVDPNGSITSSIPEHGEEGWHVIAKPDGSIYTKYDIPNTKYEYLYYEASVKNVSVDKHKGWIKKSNELLVFFADILPKLGLNEKESKDFMEYWLPKLTSEGETWYITLINQDEVNRVEPVSFSVKPDNFLRIRFYFEKLEKNSIPLYTRYEIPHTKYERNGFTVIDWGGIMGNGSCGVDEVSE